MPFINCSTPQVDAITLSLAGNPADTLPANATNVTYTLVSGGGSIAGDLYNNPNPVTGSNTVEIERCYDAPIAVDCTPSYTQALVSSNGTTATVSVTNTGSDPLLIGGTTTVNPGSTGTLSGVTITTTASGSKQACFDISCTSSALQNFCETDTCLVTVQSDAAKNITLNCPTDPITSLSALANFNLQWTDNNPPVAPDTRNYDPHAGNDVDLGQSVQYPANNKIVDLTPFASGTSGTIPITLECFDNGDTASTEVVANCVIEYEFVAATHDGGMTFSEIEIAAKQSHDFGNNFDFTFIDDDHYIAEYLYQNPDVCYWDVITLANNEKCVVEVPVPSIPNNAITLPVPTGGNDTAMLQQIMDSAPNQTYVGAGTYRLDGLTFNQPGTVVYNMPSVPAASTDIFINIRANDVRLIDCPQDGQNQGSVYMGVRIEDCDRTHLIRSGLTNMLHTGTGSGGGVRLDNCHDFHFACNTYTDLINPANGTAICRVNAYWMQGGNSSITDGGYIVNNVATNLHSTGTPTNGADDAEFFTTQLHTGHAKQVKLFANRCVDAGKRFVKSQTDGGVTMLSNQYGWITDSSVIGTRKRLRMIDVQFNTGDIIARNNRFKIEGTERWGNVFLLNSRAAQEENVHFDNNCIEINMPNPGITFDLRPLAAHDLVGGSTGTDDSMEVPNTSIKDNYVYGTGAVNYYYWMGRGYNLNTGPLDVSGNVFNMSDANNPYQGIEAQ